MDHEPAAYQPAQPSDVGRLRRVAAALQARRYRAYDDDDELCRRAMLTPAALHRLRNTLGLLTSAGRFTALSRRGQALAAA